MDTQTITIQVTTGPITVSVYPFSKAVIVECIETGERRNLLRPTKRQILEAARDLQQDPAVKGDEYY